MQNYRAEIFNFPNHCALLLATFLSVLFLTSTFSNADIAELISSEGPQGGVIVVLGCEDVETLIDIHSEGRFVVQGLDRDPSIVEAADATILEERLCGEISVRTLAGDQLPYVNDLLNVVIVNKGMGVPDEEILRVLAPLGAAWIQNGEDWRKLEKPWPADIDEWTHFLHDASGNPVADDDRIAPPRRLQWKAGPPWGRSHEFNSSMPALVSGKGRLFYIFDEGVTGMEDQRLPEKWTLIARDAFNGSLLWRQSLPKWGTPQWGSTALRFFGGDVARRLVVDGDRLFFTPEFGGGVVVLDAATGEKLQAIPETDGAQEILVDEGRVFVIRTVPNEGRAASLIISCFDSSDSRFLWNYEAGRITPQTTAVASERLVYRGPNKIACIDAATGEPAWQMEEPTQSGAKNIKGLIIAEDKVVMPCKAGLVARNLTSGEFAWSAPGPRDGSMRSYDLFYAQGAVWCSGPDGSVVGYDINSGEQAAQVFADDVQSPGHHLRCYRAKASEDYLITQFRGVEFISIDGDANTQQDWLRGSCTYGVMPANGFLYAPPHSCFCFTGAMSQSLGAFMGASDEELQDVVEDAAPGPIVQGPAYLLMAESVNLTNAWPMYRHDVQRTGTTAGSISDSLHNSWSIDLNTELTPPVSVAGLLFVAAKNQHSIIALDAETGVEQWRFAASGRIDSPPSYFRGRLVFGSADGTLYCVSANDGKLAWKRRMAPAERWIAIDGQLESVWRLHGSVAILNGLAYLSAGRSTFVDGGLFLYAVDVMTGEIQHEAHVETSDNTRVDWDGESFVPSYHIEGGNSDILVAENGSVYLNQIRFSEELAPLPVVYLSKEEVTARPSINLDDKPYVNEDIFTVSWRGITYEDYDTLAGILQDEATGVGEHEMGRHLFATSGFLDTTFFNRTFWMYSSVWPGFNHSNLAPKSGQLVVIGPENTYALKAYTSRYPLSPRLDPETKGYLLIADDNENDPTLDPRAWAKDKGMGFSRGEEPIWHQWLPIRVQAMTLAGDKLVVFGPPDVVQPGDPLAAFEGRTDCLLNVISASNGEILQELELPATPIFDGMIVAEERLFFCTQEGSIHCLESE